MLAQGIPTGTSQLVFKAIQTYADTLPVSWIQVPTKAVPDPPHPAPVLTLTPAGSSDSATTTTAAAAASASSSAGSGSTSNALGITALILAGLALVVAVLAVWLGRPRLGSTNTDESAAPTGQHPDG